MRRFLVVALSLVALAVGTAQSRAEARNPYAVAVIIGNKTYLNQDAPEVKFADRDAQAIKRYVIDVLGYSEDNIIYYENATQSTLNTVFGTADDPRGQLAKWLWRGGKSDVLVYYSGHGVPGANEQSYLMPVDGNPSAPSQTGYPLSLLYGNLQKSGARSITVLLDACFSGNSAGGPLATNASVMTRPASPGPAQPGGLVVLAAAQADQLANWDSKRRHGLFTEYFLEAVYGKADDAQYRGHGDGRITLAAVHEYLDEAMSHAAQREDGRDQDAYVSGEPATVLATLAPGHPPLRLDDAVPVAPPAPAPAERADELERQRAAEAARQQLADVQQQVQTTQQKLDDLRGTLDQTTRQRAAAQQQSEAAQQQLADLKQQVDAAQKKLVELYNTRDQATRQTAAETQQAAAELKALADAQAQRRQADADLRQSEQAAAQAKQQLAEIEDKLAAAQKQAQLAAANAAPVVATPAMVEQTLNLTGNTRRSVQEWLDALGYDPGGTDGAFGAATRTAIAAYQRSIGVSATGYLTRDIFAQLRHNGVARLATRISPPPSPIPTPAPTPAPLVFTSAAELEREGEEALGRADYSTAMALFTRAVAMGNGAAMHSIGDLYYYGHGITKDYTLAIHWFHQAAQMGNVPAMRDLAFMYSMVWACRQTKPRHRVGTAGPEANSALEAIQRGEIGVGIGWRGVLVANFPDSVMRSTTPLPSSRQRCLCL
jgi:TPR repeat protein